METEAVVEGTTTLHVPVRHAADSRGPGAPGDVPFYNPAMSGTRDISVLLAADLLAQRPQATVLDGLASFGARGLRVAVEADAPEVTLNDRTAAAVELARRNVAANGADARVRVDQRDLNVLLRSGHWAMVEVDPFGSPVSFVDAACQAVTADGLLAVTATDTAPLHGSRRAPARRRYLAEPPPRNAPGWHEAALRLLCGTVVRMAGQHDVAAVPVLAHVWDHCVRAVFRVRSGAGRADAALEHVDVATLCPTCQGWGLREASCPCGEGDASGPYWLGPLHDAELIERVLERAEDADLAQPGRVRRLLAACRDEAGLGPFYVDLHRGAKVRGVGQLAATDAVVEALKDAGHSAARAAAAPHGVVSDAPPETVLDLLEHLDRPE